MIADEEQDWLGWGERKQLENDEARRGEVVEKQMRWRWVRVGSKGKM